MKSRSAAPPRRYVHYATPRTTTPVSEPEPVENKHREQRRYEEVTTSLSRRDVRRLLTKGAMFRYEMAPPDTYAQQVTV